MAIETFTWRVNKGVSSEISYTTRAVQFGDGYEQVAGEGVNNKNESYSIEWIGSDVEAREIMAFFDRHAGYRAFFWAAPLNEVALYRCNDPSPLDLGGNKYKITGTFKKAYSSNTPT
jgi:phage-related protein